MDRAEHRILLACARGSSDADRPAIIRECVAGGLDWGYLLQAAAAHRLTSLLYWHLNLACRDAVPATVLGRLHQHFAWNSSVGLLLTARLERILAALESGAVPTIPYKGPVLAHQLYENPAVREFDDLDILVEQRDVVRTIGLLHELGYQRETEYPPTVEPHAFRQQHHWAVMKGDERVEVHWGVVPEFLGPPVPLEGWWSRTTTTRLVSRIVTTLSPEDAFVALCLHGAKHCWSSLRWVADVARLLDRRPQLDWDYLWRAHSNADLLRVVRLGIIVGNDLAAVRVPEDVLKRARSDTQVLSLARRVGVRQFAGGQNSELKSNLVAIQFQTRLRSGWRSRVRYVVRRVFTPTLADRRISLPRALSPLYFVLKIVGMMRRRGQRRTLDATVMNAKRARGE